MVNNLNIFAIWYIGSHDTYLYVMVVNHIVIYTLPMLQCWLNNITMTW